MSERKTKGTKGTKAARPANTARPVATAFLIRGPQLTEATWKALRRIALREGRTLTDVVRRLLVRALADREGTN